MLKLEDVLNQERDYTPRTPPGVMREFLEGSIHTDFMYELAVRIEGMRDALESGTSNRYLVTQGGIEFARQVAGIFEDLYNNALTDSEKGEK